jgi:hypothetical protein
MSSNHQPLWLQAVHRLERAIGQPVESVVRSDAYFDAVSKISRTRRQAVGAAESVSRRCLHLFNLPAGTDVRGLREQLSRIERRLNQLSEDVAETEDERRRAPVD